MENKRYYESLNVLINAFMKDNLHHGTTCECAVGNMIQSKGFNKNEISALHSPMTWFEVLYDFHYTDIEYFKQDLLNKKKQIDILPYTVREIMEIENSFEGRIFDPKQVISCRKDDPDGFKGLTEVAETLYQLEDWKEEESKVNLVEMCINR